MRRSRYASRRGPYPDVNQSPPNPHHRLGNDGSGRTEVPVGLTDVIAIATSNAHNLAPHADGHLTAWGNNYHGLVTVPGGPRASTRGVAGRAFESA